MPENKTILSDDVPETAKEKFERERLSRRQALKRLGMTSAMATFALFSVDDLARMVGKAMQQRAGDNKVAAQLAKEFQQAGIALAGGPANCYGCCTGSTGDPTICQDCCDTSTPAGTAPDDPRTKCYKACDDKWAYINPILN